MPQFEITVVFWAGGETQQEAEETLRTFLSVKLAERVDGSGCPLGIDTEFYLDTDRTRRHKEE